VELLKKARVLSSFVVAAYVDKRHSLIISAYPFFSKTRQVTLSFQLSVVFSPTVWYKGLNFRQRVEGMRCG
jgi:hypothetical protein